VGDTAGAAIYQATADSWQRQVEKWTYTTTGNLSDGRYYVWITANGTPDDGATRAYANGAGHPENRKYGRQRYGEPGAANRPQTTAAMSGVPSPRATMAGVPGPAAKPQ
jgi:hypothetical protein